MKGVLVAPRARSNFETFLARRAARPIHPEEFFKGNLLLYKVASPGKTPEKTESMLDRECLYKVASPGKTPEKNTFLPGLATLGEGV